MTPELLAKQIAANIGAAVKKRLDEIGAELTQRFAEVETGIENRFAALPEPINGEKGEKGDRGDDAVVDMEVVRQLILDAVALIEIPAPIPGEKGADAVVDIEELKALIAEQVKLIELPAPVAGEKGDKGDKGEDAILNMEEVAAILAGEVKKIEIPAPIPGEKGEKGDKGDAAVVDEMQIKALVDKAVAAVEIPAPIPGEKGEKGDKGDTPEIDMEAIKQIVKSVVDKIEMPKVKAQLDLEVEDGIDEERTYARGTMARHMGGLWRAFERTKGMRGWECIVAGIAAIDIDFDGERALSITVQRSEGDAEVKTFRIPAMIDKGVYREGAYEKGDMVTFSGAIWCALKDGDLGRPGTSPDWRLACKRGGTGKSAYDLARDAGFTGTRQEWLDQIGKKPTVKVDP